MTGPAAAAGRDGAGPPAMAAPLPLINRMKFRARLWWEARRLPFRIPPHTPLSEVLAHADAVAGTPHQGLAAGYILDQVRRTTRGPWMMRNRRCLRQGVLAYRFLTAAGFRPELHFGIDRDSVGGPQLSAHCWIVQDGEVVLNPPAAGMVTILKHPASAPPPPPT